MSGAQVLVASKSDLKDILRGDYSTANFQALSDSNGNASVKTRCGASFALLTIMGRIAIDHEVQVQKAGYRPITIPLANLVGGKDWRLSKQTFDVHLIMLEEAPTNRSRQKSGVVVTDHALRQD